MQMRRRNRWLIAGPGPGVLAVSRDQQAPAFGIVQVMPGHTVIIEGLTISGGSIGGGIVNGGSLTIHNCIVRNNFNEGNGGGILNSGSLTITDSYVYGNQAGFSIDVPTGYGGGISSYQTATRRDSTVSDNVAGPKFTPGPGPGYGGGIANSGTLEISNSTISNNDGRFWGGGISNHGTVTITDSTVSDNAAGSKFTPGSGFGGGISNQDHGTLTIRNSTISSNRTRGHTSGLGGGGIGSGSGNATLEISNSTISGNFAFLDGGGILNSGSLTITNSTFAYNSALPPFGGDIDNDGGMLQIGNTILQANVNGASIANFNSGVVISNGYNLSSDSGGGFLTAIGDQINTDPLLGPLQNNGGPTSTYELMPGSPAVNAGDPNFTPPPFYDQRGPGFDRVRDGRIDIGSFELQGSVLTVTSASDSGEGSLRDVLAGTGDGDLIQFAAALNGQTITLTSGELVVDRNIAISGPGPASLSVSRDQQAPAFRIFRVTPGHTVTIAGLAIRNGFAQTPSNRGGGIFNDHTILTVNNCVLSGNSAESGGGILNDGESSGSATLAINNSTLNGNTANFGAGIFTSAASSGSATLTINSSTLSNNSAANMGGAVFNEGDNGGTGTVTISNSTLSGNGAVINGGAVLNDGFAGTGITMIANSTLSGNAAGNGGVSATVFNQSGSIEIGNTIFKAGQGANLRNSGGTITSHGYNLSSDDGGGFLNGAGDQINTDPILGPLQDNGGPTFTHALAARQPGH